jgi:uncharacterized protein involved in outer membrane biogenesis
MRRKTAMSRLGTLIAVMATCLLVVMLAPLLLERRVAEESFSSSMVIASARDFFLVTMPIRLSDAPDLTLSRGAFYADNNARAGAPISKIVLDGPVFTLNASGLRASTAKVEHGPDGVDVSQLAPLMEAVTTLAFDGLTVRRGTLHVTTVDGKSETLSDIHADISGRRRGQLAARGKFTVRGQRLYFDITALPILDKKPATRWPLKVSLKGELLDLSFDGQMDVGDDLQLFGQMELSTSSLRRVARWFGVPLVQQAEGLGSAAVRGQFNWTRRTLAFERANITVDGNEAVGTLALNHSGERPLIDATLAFGALDLTPYIEAARTRPSVFEHAARAAFELSSPTLKHVDADLRLSAPKVAFNGVVLGRGAATITVNSGRLLADIAELDVPAGTVSAQVTANVNDAVPRYTLRGKLNSSDSAIAAASLLGAPLFAGRSTLSLDLSSAGHTTAEMLARLSGKASLAMPEGGRLAFDPKLLLQAAKSNEAISWAALAKTTASFDQVEVRAIIRDGVVITDAVHARAGTLGLAASGQVNLAEGKLDLRLAVKSDVPLDQPIKLSDMGDADVVTIRGPWSEPVVHRAPVIGGDFR